MLNHEPARNLLSIGEDLRYAVRLLLRSRAYTIAALLTLAIGIGSSTTVFSIVHGALLRPLPFEDSERIARILSESNLGTRDPVSLGALQNIQSVSKSFEYTAAQTSFFATADGYPSVSVSIVSLDFMKLFRMRPLMGREFTADDIKPDATPVAIISYEFWQNRLGGDPNVLGKTVIVPESLPELTVIGILTRGVRSTSLRDIESVWTPFDPERGTGMARSAPIVFGRLKARVSFKQAQGELTALQERILPAERGASQSRLFIQSMRDNLVGSSRITIMILAGAVLSVLMIVIVNLVGLDLARLPELENELSIRTALGASRWRLMQLMLVKALVLGLSGGALGVIAASVFHVQLVNSMMGVPRKEDIVMDGTVLLTSLGLSIVTSLLLGIVPALRAGRTNVRDMMHTIAPAYTGSRRLRLFQDALTAGETALALVLAIAAGLLINNLWHILSEDLGFKSDGVSSVRIELPRTYAARQRLAFYDDLMRRLKSISNIETMALTSVTPMLGGSYTSISGVHEDDPNRLTPIQVQNVSAEYFSILRIPVLAGRGFTNDEVSRNANVAVVGATLATKLWPGRNPLGRQFKWREADITVIGVVGDVQYGFYSNIRARADKRFNSAALVLERSTVYRPVMNVIPGSAQLQTAVILAKTTGSPKEIASVVRDLEPEATATPGSMSGFIAQATEQQRFQTVVLGCFGLAALLLAALGVYSVVSYSVVRRTREIGIRMALGANGFELFVQACCRAIVPGVLGMFLGLAASLTVRQVLTSYVSAIPVDDGVTYLIVVLITFAVILLACSLPARRIVRLNPVNALKCE